MGISSDIDPQHVSARVPPEGTNHKHTAFQQPAYLTVSHTPYRRSEDEVHFWVCGCWSPAPMANIWPRPVGHLLRQKFIRCVCTTSPTSRGVVATTCHSRGVPRWHRHRPFKLGIFVGRSRLHVTSRRHTSGGTGRCCPGQPAWPTTWSPIYSMTQGK